MLPFFRKIRWRLAANNQFFKYSRYAIGEIVLVVIGTLIALQVNNWNEKRKIIPILILSFCLNFFFEATSQTKKIDSLELLIENSHSRDTSLVSTLIILSKEHMYIEENLSKSIETAELALELSKELEFPYGEMVAFKQLGTAHFFGDNYESVFEYWSYSLTLAKELKNVLWISQMQSNLGALYYDAGYPSIALNFYENSLQHALEINDTLRAIPAILNIAGTYTELKDYDEALKLYNSNESYIKAFNDEQIIGTYLLGKGDVFSQINRHNKALSTFHEALDFTKNTDDHAWTYVMIGREERFLGNIDKAIESFEKAQKLCGEDGHWDRIAALIEIAELKTEVDPEYSLKTLHQAEEIASNLSDYKNGWQISNDLSKIYLAMGQIQRAYGYLEKSHSLRDSIEVRESMGRNQEKSIALDIRNKENEINELEKEVNLSLIESEWQKATIYIVLTILFFLSLLTIAYRRRYRFINKTKKIIEAEKKVSENLLLNILPAETAAELKENGTVTAKKIDMVSVMFTDFSKFTEYSKSMTPDLVVKNVNYYFSEFDRIIEKHGLEKIKTIGDAYMCAGGLNSDNPNNAEKVVSAAREILKFMKNKDIKRDPDIVNFKIRIGINTGPVVAGVVGIKKFSYDIWGDTVNIASRMESNSETGRINVSEDTFQFIKDSFDCTYRGQIHVKNKGLMKMYFVN